MADDQDFEMWDDEFLEKAIQLTEAAVCSSSSNPTQPPPPPQQLFPPPPPPHSAPHISYSPPRELSQRVKDDNHRNFPDKGFDFPVSLNGINQGLNSMPPILYSSRLHDENKCSKQKEIIRLKEELGRVSKVLTNLEQECLELRKERDKNEIHLRSVPANGSKDAEAFCSKKSNLKNKDPIEGHSVIQPVTKGTIPCKAVGVQTDELAISTDLTIKKNQSVTCPSRKLAGIWEPQSDRQPKTNLVFKLFVACEADLQALFGCVGLNMPSKKTTTKMDCSKPIFSHMAPNHCFEAAEAAKVSHLYYMLTKISIDIGRLEDLLEALLDLICLQNKMIVHRSLRVLHVVLKHISSMESKLCSRDNVIVNDSSTVNRSSGKHSEMAHQLCGNITEVSNQHHPVLSRLTTANKVWNKDSLRDDSSLLIPCSKWFCLYQMMQQIVTRHSEEIIRVEAVSIMNILLLRTDAYAEREMYGEVLVFQSISQLLRKEAGLGVQKQTVRLLYLLLNCPKLMSIFCSSCKEVGTTAEVLTTNSETVPAFHSSSAILDGLADCLACRRNGAPTLVLKLQRNTIILLAFLASLGRRGFEILLGYNLPRRTNFLYLILQILASEIDVEASDRIQPFDNFRERKLVIREALILLNRLVSNSQYSTAVLCVLTNRRDMACLTMDIASRLSQKGKGLWQPDTMRESEIVDLARIFKKRVFAFVEDAHREKEVENVNVKEATSEPARKVLCVRK
ncbi:uncharacterized protein LOC112521971 isoform X2 [Cynara cardunculus var. scolymus]|uniref:uncharacterized protein LOC112521971 isoform X2 n=1 Tax=Cynara cardunculus var. scolymus TaxID=59895 RepID=UPI000D630D6D|nr:uncharacterized protein LOC112521971 isoform X2 [Cynara cardunculus var. scolymus]